ncbi:hypothetical protein [Tenacibaculum maritimum]|uniref:hypothetical protein n=1 Tax=Tenacibaculum maritimum TaxID=107401 RepID=UPI001E42DE24|nr:hypothetical protein [Tenacibaculum maritimum]MCD9584878.1 hypothetical protein [Tenacibaculum maritimum]MCD9620612.1 hypothetical protein [Tenacibaculum maritimum]MCD9626011.1 hypothetical protein [Tenacibaculum maritimum]MCD9631449.1 hypothetical protein [Tenacibaculum maritimum]MCD9634401.1 hypothetical protein [Tenacibaculum maritimum]
MEKEAIEIIYEGLIGVNSIPNDIRIKKEFNIDKLNKIKSAINVLTPLYKDKISVPKKLAVCFIDIYGMFQFKEDFFSEEELIMYEDIGIELQDLAYQLFE